MFVVISVLTLGSAAVALNYMAGKTAENNLVSLTTEQSMRDASIIAGIVNQLFSDQGTIHTDEPARLTEIIPIKSQNLLDSLRVIDIAVYDTSGRNLWSTSGDRIAERTITQSVLDSAVLGRIESNLGSIEILTPLEPPQHVDVIETYLPLLGNSEDEIVGVIGITRDVTTTLTTQIQETRASVTVITLVSLGIVFLILLVIVFVADIKIFQANIQKLGSERELNDRLMLDSLELKRVGQMKDRFLSSLTHELMTPLTSISAFTGILLRNRNGNLGSKDIDHLEVMKRNTIQLQRLLDDLLELSLLNKGEHELSYSRFNLRQTLEEVTEAFMPAVVRKKQILEFNFEETDAIVEADDIRLRQVISNLLANAIMYSPEGTDITISAWVSDLLFTITIDDNGIGIVEEDKAEIFTLFFRADNESTRSVAGTGIGLVSAKQIVDMHGGELTLKSEQGKGTNINVSIPRYRTRQSLENGIIGAA